MELNFRLGLNRGGGLKGGPLDQGFMECSSLKAWSFINSMPIR